VLSFYIHHYFNYTIVIVESDLLIAFCLCQLKYNDNLLTVQFVHGKAEPPKEMFNYDAQLSPSGSVPKGNYHNKQPFYSFESPVLNNEYDFILPSGRGSAPKGNYQNKQPFYSFESPVLNNESNFIRLRSTYTIINGVRKLLFDIYFLLFSC
jgi:hypothetical protein